MIRAIKQALQEQPTLPSIATYSILAAQHPNIQKVWSAASGIVSEGGTRSKNAVNNGLHSSNLDNTLQPISTWCQEPSPQTPSDDTPSACMNVQQQPDPNTQVGGTAASMPAANSNDTSSVSTPDDNAAPVKTPPSSVALTLEPSINYKTFTKIIQWGTYSYTIRESLPDTTKVETWDEMVKNYLKILEDHQDYAGVSRLSLTLDHSSEGGVCIDIPERGFKNTVPSSKNSAVAALIRLHKTDMPTKINADLAQDVAAANSGASPLNQQDPPAIDPLRTITRPIPNRRNTCFIASVCQAWLIYQKTALQNKKNHPDTSPEEKQIAQELLNWIDSYEKKETADVTPIVDLLKKSQPTWFVDGALQQQDAQEFMQWLLDFMILESVTIQTENVFDTNETLLLEHSDPQPDSSYIALSFNPTQTNVSLDSLVHQHFNPEMRGGGACGLATVLRNGVPSAQAEKFAIKSQKIRFINAPQDLTLHIKRFNSARSKLENDVDVKEEVTIDQQRYQLESFIVHVGPNVSVGHYVAYVRKTNPQTRKDYFVLANDAEINEEVTLPEFLTAAKKAYLLCYKRI